MKLKVRANRSRPDSADHAVLIPSKGRPKALAKLFVSCPSLNAPHTYIGVERAELDLYTQVMGPLWSKVNVVVITNPDGITSWAREQLRRVAVKKGYTRYVLSDDNCRFSGEALQALLDAQALTHGVVAGSHKTAPHFQSDRIERGTTHVVSEGKQLLVYPHVGMIFWCIPGVYYREFRYPLDCYYDDVYLILWLASKGFTNFTACLEAVFDKHRHEPGGTGNDAQRVLKMAQGLQRLAWDFPQWMVSQWVQTRVPYTKIMEAAANGQNGFR